jgi:hypothetical protein
MGIFDKIKQVFKKKPAIESASKRSDTDLKRSNNRFKALQSASDSTINGEKESIEHEDYHTNGAPLEPTELSRPVELQKESLQLGVAAGYTGRSIREIESSLNRIERGMASREWMQTTFGDQKKTNELLAEIKEVLTNHDSNALKRFEAIEIALNRMILGAKDAPEPLKRSLITEIEAIRANLPLSPKMRRLLLIVKQTGKISYDNLATRLNISRSALRGLLANTMKRTTEIERFSVAGKGWVRYKHPKTTQIDTFS